jgi:hypothetical protein
MEGAGPAAPPSQDGHGTFGDASAGGGGTLPVAGETPMETGGVSSGMLRDVPRSGALEQSGLAESPSGQRNATRSQKPVAGLHIVSPEHIA